MKIVKNKLIMGILLVITIVFIVHIITTLLWICFGASWEYDFLPNHSFFMVNTLMITIIRIVVMGILSGIMMLIIFWLWKKEKDLNL